MRSMAQLDQLSVSEWTEDEGFAHLSATFEAAERAFPEIMEPHSVRLADAVDRADKIAIMRRGLRSTLDQRFPRAAQQAAE